MYMIENYPNDEIDADSIKSYVNKIADASNENQIELLYELSTGDKTKLKYVFLLIIWPFLLIKIFLYIFFIASIPTDIQFLEQFIAALMAGNIKTFLNSQNLKKTLKIFSRMGISYNLLYLSDKFLSKKSLLTILQGLSWDIIIKICDICLKLSAYRGFFSLYLMVQKIKSKLCLEIPQDPNSVTGKRKILLNKCQDLTEIINNFDEKNKRVNFEIFNQKHENIEMDIIGNS